MSLTAISTALASPVLKAGLELLLPVVHDVLGGGKAADRIVSKVKLKALEIDGTRIVAQHDILKRDLEGNWLQRSWRPISMFVFMFILVHHVVTIPIINAIFRSELLALCDPELVKSGRCDTNVIAPDAQLVYKIIDVIKWAMSGYIAGRTGEKVTEMLVSGGIKKQQIVVDQSSDLPPPTIPPEATLEEVPFMRTDRD